jgi:tRNA pseudouridine32 synthase/23S rRNA pseudouridine746 synthase
MQKFSVKKTVAPDDASGACDFLAAHTGLSKSKIKDAMSKGAVWLRRKKKKRERLRRATAVLAPGDVVECYYDEKLLACMAPRPTCITDKQQYSAWFKPPGLLTQGTMYGDHCSLLRQAETSFRPRRLAFPVHRLDREASGLVLVAHTRDAAAKLSRLFQNGEIEKQYRIEVLGDLTSYGNSGNIALPLDDKKAFTEFEVDTVHPATKTTTVTVTIRTGRLHQIRRHFEMIGFPIMGDPRYGRGNKNEEGLQLTSTGLKFICPFSHKIVSFQLNTNGSAPSLRR